MSPSDGKRRRHGDRDRGTPASRHPPEAVEGEGTLPAEDVDLPRAQPCRVHDTKAPQPVHERKTIHERRPAPRVRAEGDAVEPGADATPESAAGDNGESPG